MTSSPSFSLGAQDLLNNLIPEILGEIFQACIEDSDDGAEPSLSCAPISISQVCRRWRQVALRTPRLWSSFSMVRHHVKSESDKSSLKRIIPVIKLWIDRSSFAPLNFKIHLRLDETTEELAEETESLLRLLIKHQTRWKAATIIYDAPQSRWFDVTLSEMSMLRQLQIECCSGLDCFMRLDLSQSAGLKTLFLQGNIRMIDSELLPNLVEAHLLPGGFPSSTFPTLYDCHRILRRSPSLEIIDVTCNASTCESSYEHIKMENLQLLRLRLGGTFVTSRERVSKLFEHLTLPSLNALDISCHSVVDESPVETQLLNMLERSEAPVTTLMLSSPAVKQEHLVTLLQLLPSLKKLRLNDMKSLDSVLTSLTLTGDGRTSGDVCPGLEKIYLGYIESLTLSSLSTCIKSRWWGPENPTEDCAPFSSSLKEVSVLHCVVHGELFEEIHGYVREGLIAEFINTRI